MANSLLGQHGITSRPKREFNVPRKPWHEHSQKSEKSEWESATGYSASLSAAFETNKDRLTPLLAFAREQQTKASNLAASALQAGSALLGSVGDDGVIRAATEDAAQRAAASAHRQQPLCLPLGPAPSRDSLGEERGAFRQTGSRSPPSPAQQGAYQAFAGTFQRLIQAANRVTCTIPEPLHGSSAGSAQAGAEGESGTSSVLGDTPGTFFGAPFSRVVGKLRFVILTTKVECAHLYLYLQQPRLGIILHPDTKSAKHRRLE